MLIPEWTVDICQLCGDSLHHQERPQMAILQLQGQLKDIQHLAPVVSLCRARHQRYPKCSPRTPQTSVDGRSPWWSNDFLPGRFLPRVASNGKTRRTIALPPHRSR